MKHIIVLLFLIGFQFSSFLFGQQKVTLQLNDATLTQCLKAIEKQTNLGFLYSGKELSAVDNIDINVSEKNVEDVLKTLLNSNGFTFKIENNTILIKKAPEKNTQQPNQKRTIRGYVYDEQGKPLPFVNIWSKEYKFGTSSNDVGYFIIEVPKDADILVLSFIGYKKQEVKIKNKFLLKITLYEETTMLDDVVAVGYQIVERRDLVGATTVVKMKDIRNIAVNTIDEMLQGQVAGMIITRPSGRVTSSPKIKIRGTSTILGNTEPLWVVDGIIQPDFVDLDISSELGDLENIIGNQVSWLNPDDIESVTVLKDASATAVYGSKASNGVVIVTTKRGKKGEMSINYSSNFSFRSAPNYGMYNMMNSQERIDISKDAFNEGVLYRVVPLKQPYTYEGLMRMYLDKDITMDYFKEQLTYLETVNTNWFEELTQNSLSQSHNLSLSGGSKTVKYISSFSFANDQGVEIGDAAKRITGRLRVDIDPSEKLKVSFNVAGSSNNNSGFGIGVNPRTYALNTSRAIPFYEQNGDQVYYQERSYYRYNGNTQEYGLGYNIINERDNGYSTAQSVRLNTSLNLRWQISDMFRYEIVGGYSLNNRSTENYAGEETFFVANRYRGYLYGEYLPGSPEYQAAILPHGGVMQTTVGDQSSYNIQNKLLFSHPINDMHRINAMLGHEVRSTENFEEGNMIWGYLPGRGQILVRPALPDELVPLNSSTSYEGFGILDDLYNKRWKRNQQTQNFISLFATLAYSYNDKYTMNANVRTDESNRFGQDVNNRFDPTWSVGFAWSMHEENFIKDKLDWLNQAKWRFSYGMQGNVLTNRSPEMITNSGSFNPVYGQYQSNIIQLPNPYLNWEKTKSWNIGLDLRLFKKFTTSLEYYGRRSSVIALQQVAQYNGLDALAINGAEITNQGYEVTVSFQPVSTKNWYWNISINTGMNINKSQYSYVPENMKRASVYVSGSNQYVLKEGYDLSSFWSYSYVGLNPETGYPMFDLNPYNDEKINALEVDPNTGNYMSSDKSIDPTDFLIYSGKKEPGFAGGISSSLRFKSLTLATHLSAQLGHKMRLPNPYVPMLNGIMPEPTTNLDKELTERWQQPGDELNTTIPGLPTNGVILPNMPYGGSPDHTEFAMWGFSDIRVVDASFIRLNNLSLTWNVPKEIYKKAGFENMSLSTAASNLFVIASKDLEGFDPESGSRSVRPKTYSLSLKIGF
ncbi:MAG: SusC/RagA family TonB-linked outer membrane protein [Bacteroidota bacterium]